MTNNTALTIISLAMMLAFVVPFGIFLLTGKRIKTGKKMLALNIISFFAIVVGTVVFSANGGPLDRPCGHRRRHRGCSSKFGGPWSNFGRPERNG